MDLSPQSWRLPCEARRRALPVAPRPGVWEGVGHGLLMIIYIKTIFLLEPPPKSVNFIGSCPRNSFLEVRAALAEDRAVSGAGSEHGGPEARDRLAASVGRAGRLSGSVTPRPRAPWGAKSFNFQLATHQQRVSHKLTIKLCCWRSGARERRGARLAAGISWPRLVID